MCLMPLSVVFIYGRSILHFRFSHINSRPGWLQTRTSHARRRLRAIIQVLREREKNGDQVGSGRNMGSGAFSLYLRLYIYIFKIIQSMCVRMCVRGCVKVRMINFHAEVRTTSTCKENWPAWLVGYLRTRTTSFS